MYTGSAGDASTQPRSAPTTTIPFSAMGFGTPPRRAHVSTTGASAATAETLFVSPSSPAPRRPGNATPNSVASSHLRGRSSPSSPPRQYRRQTQNHARLSPPPLSSQASVDRYVSASSRQATSMAHFLLTSRERKTPMLIRAAQQQQQQHLAIHSPSRDLSFDMSPSLEDSYNSLVRYAVERSSSRHGAVASPRPRRSLPLVGSAAMTPSSARLSSVFAKMHLDPSTTVHSSRERSGSSPSLMGIRASGGCGAQLGDDGRTSPSSAMELEPYTTKLARTLFSDVEQTTVLPVNDTAAIPLGITARKIGGCGHAEMEEARNPVNDGEMGLGNSSALGGRGTRCHRTDENDADNNDDGEEADWMCNEDDEQALPSSAAIRRSMASVSTRVPLAMSEVNQFGMAEGARFDASLGVVFECNRTRNFTTSSFRVIPHTPERILDAADMEDDFYMNLIDWSATSDVLCVALHSCVYLWDAKTCGITELPRVASASVGVQEDGHSSDTQLVCGLNWAPDGHHLAVGRHSGAVEVWDVETQQIVHTYRQHTDRTVSLSWEPLGGWLLASGSRDSTVVLRDVRECDTSTSASVASLSSSSLARATSVLRAHETEVCGLKWSPTGAMLASGGNDNQLLLWDRRSISTGSHGSTTSRVYRNGECQPIFFLNKHTAAVKALSWNPAQPALLASGGGSHDKALRFWNSLTGECVHHINTGSQVCGVVWNRSGTELVTAHGYTDNQLSIWRYPSLRRIANLIGHTSRVLHLALSADGQTVVSAAGDETLRFWRCFPANELRESSPHLHRSSYSSMKGFSISSSTYGGGVGISPGGASASMSSIARARALAIASGRCGSLSQDRDSRSLMNEEIELR
ncbi:cell division cycle protein, putative [Leishmania tarentolae]|uniref:Cell division cycle protein, putative n=1 Tax=Leishmania tarentolae TaxID=5689 RepID=A0A640KH32_LEITA|nr:cell division cycle protein, putative [Leishmania tarentolae]